MLDLSKRPEIRIYIPANSFEHILKDSARAYERQLWRRIIVEHRTNLPANAVFNENVMTSVQDGKGVVISSRPAAGHVASVYCQKMHRGEFYTAQEPVLYFNAMMGISRRIPSEIRRSFDGR